MTLYSPCSGTALLARAGREPPEWLSMKTAPKDGEEILGQIEDTTAICYWDATIDDGEGAWINAHTGRVTCPDCWQPL